MAEFNRDQFEHFLATVRKYMQLHGPLSQKELAELTEVGVSTMSRFFSQKTTELNAQLIAKIIAKLDIPLHEIIDFVDEDFAERLIRLVKFYKDEVLESGPETAKAKDKDKVAEEEEEDKERDEEEEEEEILEDEGPLGKKFIEGFSTLGTAQKKTKVTITTASGGKKRTIPFEVDEDAPNSALNIKEKLERLSPRQRAYMAEFLNLDMEGRDLIVDLGHSIFRFLKQKGMTF